MKYADYQKKRTQLEAVQTARYEAGEKERAAPNVLYETIKREWNLGSPQFLDSGARSDHGDVVVIYDGGNGFRIEIRDRSLMQHYGMELSRQYLQLSAAQWHMFAEVVDAVTRWRAGEIDTLPSSGVWHVIVEKGKNQNEREHRGAVLRRRPGAQ